MKAKQPERQIRKRSIGRGLAVWLSGCLALLLLGGCKGSSGGRSDAGEAPPDVPSYQALVQAHNRRVEQLQTIYADGVIELRWRDEKGEGHFEQGNMELWLHLEQAPRTALRIEKLGEVLLWLGSDAQNYWLFDMLPKEGGVLHIGPHEAAIGWDRGTGPFNLRPLVLLDLLALTPLPEHASNDSVVDHDPKRRAWIIECDGRGGRVRVFFDQASQLPSAVEAIDEAGHTTLISTMSRYETVRVRGMLPVGAPKMAEVVEIVAAARRDEGPSGEVKLFINDAAAHFEPDVLERVFDVHRLVAGLNPGRIEGSLPAREANTGEPD